MSLRNKFPGEHPNPCKTRTAAAFRKTTGITPAAGKSGGGRGAPSPSPRGRQARSDPTPPNTPTRPRQVHGSVRNPRAGKVRPAEARGQGLCSLPWPFGPPLPPGTPAGKRGVSRSRLLPREEDTAPAPGRKPATRGPESRSELNPTSAAPQPGTRSRRPARAQGRAVSTGLWAEPSACPPPLRVTGPGFDVASNLFLGLACRARGMRRLHAQTDSTQASTACREARVLGRGWTAAREPGKGPCQGALLGGKPHGRKAEGSLPWVTSSSFQKTLTQNPASCRALHF